MKLNPSQQAVAHSRESRVLVLAGAGTGKTATSVHWVSELIRQGTARAQVLMITFTRKAANEMATRIERLVAEVPRRSLQDKLTVGTYHAVASQLLREEAEGFGLTNRNFSTLDESECQSVWKSALKQCGLTSKSSLFVPSKLHQLYSLARNTCTPLAEHFEPLFGPKHLKKMLKVVVTYEELKRAANVVDYDDLLVLWRDRLQREPAYALLLRQRWTYVLVDEMQDNNQLNAAILEHLDPAHLLVVGDANQSIYGFRGSDVRLIQSFTSRYPQARTFKLEDNYRSGQHILDLANHIVADTPSALCLHSASGGESQIDYRCYQTTALEAQGVLHWFNQRREAGHKPETSAVLSRSSKALTELEVTLNAHRVRYKKYGGQAIADAAEVKDFISFLRITLNMQDKIALLRALMQFPGIGEGTAAKVIASHQGDLFGASHWPSEAEELPHWVAALQKIPALADQGFYLQEKLKPLILANYPKDGEDRLGTISALVESMKPLTIGLAEFLDGFVLNRGGNDYHPEEAVVLSTIHSAKGLEWDGVWLIGAGSAQIPHPRALEAGDIEEERRLFYVATTRARRHLVLSFAGTTDRGQSQRPCPFIPENTKWDFLFGG